MPRRRIRHENVGAWTPVYAGTDNSYAVEALVPDRAVRDEPGLSVACEFMLRTQGTEYGWDKISHEVVSSPEFSRPSPIASFRTESARYESGIDDAYTDGVSFARWTTDLDLATGSQRRHVATYANGLSYAARGFGYYINGNCPC